MSRLFNLIKEFPVLFSIFGVQLLIITSATLLFLMIIRIDMQSRMTQEISKLEATLSPIFHDRLPQWRTWELIGMHELLEQELQSLKNEYPIESVQLTGDLRLTPDEAIVFQPANGGPLSVTAIVDKQRLRAEMSPDQVSYWLLILILTAFLSVMIASLRVIYKEVWLPLQQVLQLYRSTDQPESVHIEARGEIRIFIRLLQEALERAKNNEVKAARIALAEQVSHDVRSPLAALKLATTGLDSSDREHKSLIVNSVSRIESIVSEILSKEKPLRKLRSSHSNSPQLLQPVIASLIAEKRALYTQIDIEEHYAQDFYFSSSSIDIDKLKRALSNLIDNAADASEQSGVITIRLSLSKDDNTIEIEDRGMGLPQEVLAQIGTRGFSWGKEKGNGLGVYYAKQVIQEAGGELSIESEPQRGSVARIRLPKTPPPPWLATRLPVEDQETIVIVDDDRSVHELWKRSLKNHVLVQLGKLSELEEWFDQNHELAATCVFLIDYRFENESENGLDLIERLKISDRAYLVTSSFDEISIQSRVQRLNCRMIPKPLIEVLGIIQRKRISRIALAP